MYVYTYAPYQKLQNITTIRRRSQSFNANGSGRARGRGWRGGGERSWKESGSFPLKIHSSFLWVYVYVVYVLETVGLRPLVCVLQIFLCLSLWI